MTWQAHRFPADRGIGWVSGGVSPVDSTGLEVESAVNSGGILISHLTSFPSKTRPCSIERISMVQFGGATSEACELKNDNRTPTVGSCSKVS